MRLTNTVKVITSLVLITALVFGVSIYTKNIIDSTSRNLENQVTVVEDNTRAGNWEKAEAELSNMEKDWSRTKKIWAMLLDHIEVDNIDETLSKMSRYIESRESSLALAEASTLKQFIKHIPEKESFKLENIF